VMLEEPNCYIRKCKYWYGFVKTKDSRIITVCLVFPKGIPDDIAYGEDKHEKVIDGQVGNFVYEKEK